MEDQETDSREKSGKDFSKWLKIDGKTVPEAEFCAWINRQVLEHPVARMFHGKWKELIEWEKGNQFSIWDDMKRDVVPVHLALRKARVVVNIMKPLIKTLESKVDVSHSVIGTPNSGEEKDVRGAQVATRFLAFNDTVNVMPEKLDTMKYDMMRPGQACLKWIWDKDFPGAKVAPRKGAGVDRKKEADEEGEVVCRNVPIFNVRPDPTANCPEEMRWLVELIQVRKNELMDIYDLSEEEAEFLTSGSSDDTKFNGMNVDNNLVDKNESTGVIKEFWEKPNRHYKKGRYIVTCEDRVILADENPSPDGEIPYFFFYYEKSPYSFWCWGPGYYIQDEQRITNRLESLATEHIEAWKPKMMVGQGALIRANSMTMDTCELVEVDQSRGEPKAMQMPVLSPEVSAHRDFHIRSAGETLQVHEVSQARLPEYASRASGTLYQQMLEQEDLKLDPMIRQANTTFIKMDRLRLKLMQKHYSMPRMVKIVGKNRATSVDYYAGADIGSNFDVILERGVSIHQSASIQVRLMMEMFTAGLLDVTDKPKILKILSLGTGEFDLRDDTIDVERAIRENQAFLDGTWDKPWKEGGVAIYDHDDDEVHLEQHSNFVKTEEFLRLPEEAIVGLLDHTTAHFIKLAMISNGQPGQTPQKPGVGTPSASDAAAGAGGGGGAQAPNGAPPGPMPTMPGNLKVQTLGGSRVMPQR